MKRGTLEDAEQLLQPAADPVVGSLAIRKAASILYSNWVDAAPADREQLARRFIFVVQQPEILPVDGVFDGKDLGLLVGLLRISLQVDPPDLAVAERVLSALDQAEVDGRSDSSFRSLEIQSLRIEALLALPFPDFEQLTERLGALGTSASDPYVRRAALLLIRAARRSLDQRPAGVWGINEEHAAGAIRTAVSLVIGDQLSQSSLEDGAIWQLVRTRARTEEERYEAMEDEVALREAFELYAKLVEARPLQKQAIAGLARTATALGRTELARDSWQTLMNSATPGSPEFFEAKCLFLESIVDSDPDRTRSILEQHAVFYPAYGTEPWGDRLRALHERVGRSEGRNP